MPWRSGSKVRCASCFHTTLSRNWSFARQQPLLPLSGTRKSDHAELDRTLAFLFLRGRCLSALSPIAADSNTAWLEKTRATISSGIMAGRCLGTAPDSRPKILLTEPSNVLISQLSLFLLHNRPLDSDLIPASPSFPIFRRHRPIDFPISSGSRSFDPLNTPECHSLLPLGVLSGGRTVADASTVGFDERCHNRSQQRCDSRGSGNSYP